MSFYLRMIKDSFCYLNTLGLRGLLRSFFAKLRGEQIIKELKRSDLAHPVFIRLPSTDVPTYKKVFIDKEYSFSVVDEPKTIIDAGANIGLASVYFANRFPQAKIIAIEPEISNFSVLKKNVAKYPNVLPINAALWHNQEQIQLVDPGVGSWGFRTQSSADSRGVESSVFVQSITLSDLIKDFNLDRICVLKMDIEGAEKEVFSQASNWIDLVDLIIIELHERIKPGCESTFNSVVGGGEARWKNGENVMVRRKSNSSQPKTSAH